MHHDVLKYRVKSCLKTCLTQVLVCLEHPKPTQSPHFQAWKDMNIFLVPFSYKGDKPMSGWRYNFCDHKGRVTCYFCVFIPFS